VLAGEAEQVYRRRPPLPARAPATRSSRDPQTLTPARVSVATRRLATLRVNSPVRHTFEEIGDSAMGRFCRGLVTVSIDRVEGCVLAPFAC